LNPDKQKHGQGGMGWRGVLTAHEKNSPV
jgi:hypothetical protein